MSEAVIKQNLEDAKPEFLLEPVVNIGLLDFERVKEAIDLGRKAAEEAMPGIKKELGM